jgi:hypothetical protein
MSTDDLIEVAKRSVAGHLGGISRRRQSIAPLEEEGVFSRERLIQARIVLREMLAALSLSLAELHDLEIAAGLRIPREGQEDDGTERVEHTPG